METQVVPETGQRFQNVLDRKSILVTLFRPERERLGEVQRPSESAKSLSMGAGTKRQNLTALKGFLDRDVHLTGSSALPLSRLYLFL